MNEYKKRSIKFCNNNVSRDLRHAETLKARESSRFERLSMVRDINESDFEDSSVEHVETNQTMEKPPLSRLDMLRKWKQEKMLKKELENRSKVKPFYVGSSSSAGVGTQIKQNMKFTSNTSNVSKLVENRLFTSSKLNSSNVNSKQENAVSKPVSCVSKGSSIPAFPKRPIKNSGNPSVSAINKMSFASRSGNKNSKLPTVKSISTEMTKSSKGTISLQKTKQESTGPKLTFSRLPSKTVQKASGPTVIQKSTAPGKVPPKISTLKVAQKPSVVTPKPPGKLKTIGDPKAKPTQSSNSESKVRSLLPGEKNPLLTKNVTLRKGFCFKKAVTDARKEQAEKKKNECSYLENQKNNKNPETKPCKIETVSTQSLESKSNVTLNCDVSVIKPSDSFAPDGFKFQPPSSLSDFLFEDDDDPFAVLEDFAVKYLSRTSTPSKDQGSSSKTSVSPAKSPSEKALNDSALKDLQTVKEDHATVSITEEILENLSCTKSPTLNDRNHFTEDEKTSLANKNETQESNPDGNLKADDYDNENIQNTHENHSECSDMINDYIKLEVQECSPKTESCRGNLVPEKAEECSPKCESPFDIVDVNQINDLCEEAFELLELENENVSKKVDLHEDAGILEGSRKSSGISHKGISTFKNMSKLNVIVENSECGGSINLSTKPSESNLFTPRRSTRLAQKHFGGFEDSAIDQAQEQKLIPDLSFTPRRSLRLQKPAITVNEMKSVCSPFKTAKQSVGIRRSMRLIDLNTPEKDAVEPGYSKCNITEDFEKLNLNETENVDPNAFLIDFDSPVTELKSRKVSLLYSPRKRNSIRKSIRGDLMSFSPSE